MSYKELTVALAEALEEMPSVSIKVTDLEDLLDIANRAALLTEAMSTRGEKPTARKRELERALDRFFDVNGL